VQVRPSRPEYNAAMGIEELVAGYKSAGDKDEGTEDEVCRDLCDETVDIRVPVKGIQSKSLESTKKGILDHIEAADEQKRKGEDAAERIDDKLQEGETEYVEPYIFEKYGVFFSEGYGVEEKERFVPVCGADRAGNNKQWYLDEKTGEEYELGAVIFYGPWPCLFFYTVVPEKDICHAKGYRNKSAGQKELRLEKQHAPVAACVSKIIKPQRCKVDLTAYVDAGKHYESEQCECAGFLVTPLLQVA